MKVEIFGKENCNFCVRAKDLLSKKRIPFSYVDFFALDDIQQKGVSDRAPEAKSFPIIIVDDVYVGGYSDIAAVI